MHTFVAEREAALEALRRRSPSLVDYGVREARKNAHRSGSVSFELVEQDITDPDATRYLIVMADTDRACLLEARMSTHILPLLEQLGSDPLTYIIERMDKLAGSVNRFEFDRYEVVCGMNQPYVVPEPPD